MQKPTLYSLSPTEEAELVKFLPELNVNGYTVVTKRTSVRLFVTMHRGPFQPVEHREKKNLIGLSDVKSCHMFINRHVLPQFFNKNVGRTYTHDAFKSFYIKTQDPLIDATTARIRSQTAKINREMLPKIKAGRADSYKATIKREILSACRLTKQDPVEFMRSMMNEFVVESTICS